MFARNPLTDEHHLCSSNLTLYPWGNFEDRNQRYVCTPCSGEYPLTRFQASSSHHGRDECMQACPPGTKSQSSESFGLGNQLLPCPLCGTGQYSERTSGTTCDSCATDFTTPFPGSPTPADCYQAEIFIEHIWRIGRTFTIQFEWLLSPASHARIDDMISVHSGPQGRPCDILCPGGMCGHLSCDDTNSHPITVTC